MCNYCNTDTERLEGEPPQNECMRLQKVRTLQLKQIEIIRLFEDICRKEDLRYFLLCGTMLGAVRHHGYIPWDDDADIGMPRGDYEKFLRIAEHYLSEDIYLSTVDTDIDCTTYSARLVSRTKEVIFSETLKKDRIGTWIDIFPLDGMPDNPVLYRIHLYHVLFLQKCFSASVFDHVYPLSHIQYVPTFKRVMILLFVRLSLQRLFSKERWFKRLDKALRKADCDTSGYYADLTGAYKRKGIFRKEVFGDGCLYEFEGMQLRGPENYDFYLTQIYGDYMTPPPESKRHGHGDIVYDNK